LKLLFFIFLLPHCFCVGRCFPLEGEQKGIHKVIDFIHEKVQNALELISREEKNRSLQSFFKELNDHTTNSFEFGKQFLAYLLYPTTKIPGNLITNVAFDRRTYETGKLHSLLENATNVVIESYVEDMNLTHERTQPGAPRQPLGQPLGQGTGTGENSPYGSSQHQQQQAESKGGPENMQLPASEGAGGEYLIDISDFEESTLRGVIYSIEICDPKGLRWLVRRTYAEFETLHGVFAADKTLLKDVLERLVFPARLQGTKMFRDKTEYYAMARSLQGYLCNALSKLWHFSKPSHAAVCAFLEVKDIVVPGGGSRVLKRAEHVPNVFISMKRDFADMLLLTSGSSATSTSTKAGAVSATPATAPKESAQSAQSMAEMRKVWGIEMTLKIFEGYALLQRMATVLGWTLEINHFFISMFGNTLTFSKLPLRDIIFLQKDIMTRFLGVCNDLFQFACKINADSKYKWHKNLQMVENNLNRVKFHIDKAVNLIGLIDTEHLDYETQMRRLRDVHARFQPLMNRIDGNLCSIQEELSLPVTAAQQSYMNAQKAAAAAAAGSMSAFSEALPLPPATPSSLAIEDDPMRRRAQSTSGSSTNNNNNNNSKSNNSSSDPKTQGAAPSSSSSSSSLQNPGSGDYKNQGQQQQQQQGYSVQEPDDQQQQQHQQEGRSMRMRTGSDCEGSSDSSDEEPPYKTCTVSNEEASKVCIIS
jgi:hypothetical protein